MRWLDGFIVVSGFAAMGASFRPTPAPVAKHADLMFILNARCISCHSGEKPAAGLDLSKGVDHLADMYVIAKGDPDNSLLMKRIVAKGPRMMPPGGPPLSDDDTAVVKEFIEGLKPDPTPVFQAHCVGCHSGAGAAGHLDLTESLKVLGSSSEVVPGHPDSSLLVKRITGAVAPQMPPGKPPLSDAEMKTVKNWIAGLNDPTPIIYGRCMPCHSSTHKAGGLDLALSPAKLAQLPQIVPGDPDGSTLMKRITGKAMPQMPPGGHNLSADQIDFLNAWIRGLKS